ncbi:hypothetical protein HERIO_2410 [Hepatospora eriocheir]|uniref:Uncharacterized protein n=1 Tax=Hepatospora eriocheir TaxID=1081669 RepID=A0A1X0Q739_9MICR|nr:hypothetical protein HERIO_2410 [Hepatospora eriocheir]
MLQEFMRLKINTFSIKIKLFLNFIIYYFNFLKNLYPFILFNFLYYKRINVEINYILEFKSSLCDFCKLAFF